MQHRGRGFVRCSWTCKHTQSCSTRCFMSHIEMSSRSVKPKVTTAHILMPKHQVPGSIYPSYLRNGQQELTSGEECFSPYYFWESSWLRKVSETYRIIVENNKRSVCFHCSCSLKITAGFYFCFCLIILPQKEFFFFFLGHTVLPNAICLWVKASKSQMNHKSCPKASSTAVKWPTCTTIFWDFCNQMLLPKAQHS